MVMDHREVGKEMDLFHIQEEAAGSIFWHENGWFLYNKIREHMRNVQRKYGYREVNTPQMVKRDLWERSGHWANYKENMFCVSVEDEETEYALKPMNCACHIQIYNRKVISYRDLPLRYAEFGTCMRNEPSGALSGLMRVRSFVQDDAHIFCREDQILSEVQKFSKMVDEVYYHFGFTEVYVKFSTRPDKSAGTDEQWEKSEKALKDACDSAGLNYEMQPGEGAFYGPKLEFMIKDRNEKEWQCGTIQVDFVLPERLGCKFTDQDGEIKTPVILHRAILGSFERFIGILLENHGYDLPLWMNPRALAVIDISEDGFNSEMQYLTGLEPEQIVVDNTKEDLRGLIKKYSLMKYKLVMVYGKREESSMVFPINVLGGKREIVRLDEMCEFTKRM